MSEYAKQLRWAKLKVGIVITIALVIVFLAVMFAGNIENFFAPRAVIYALVDDVKGLREGSPVWFSGVEVGSVQSIDFTIQQKIKVEMSILAGSLNYLKKDSTANILTLGLLGDKYVEISPGSRESGGLKVEDTIMGKTQTEIQDVVETSQESIAKISDFVNMLENIIVKIERGEGTVSKFLGDPAVYNNLKDAIAELTRLIKRIESGQGTVGRLLNEDGLYRDVSSAVEDVKLFAGELRNSEGSLDKFITDPSLYDRFQKAAGSLDAFAQRLEESEGTVGKLIDDKSLYENVNAASEKLGSLLERIDRGEGIAGSLVRDDELSQELKSTLKELNALMKDIKEHPGRYFKFSLF